MKGLKGEAVKFTIWGMGANFKRPHINTVNLTYSNIHKISLLGILGAIIGLKGHKDKKEDTMYPEFYENLRKLKVSIVPYEYGFTNKFIKTFTNTTGFANKRSTLIVKEQVITNPKWDIYIKKPTEDKEIAMYDKIKKYLLNKESEYEIFLGKNHFSATIENVEVISLENIKRIESPININSLVLANNITLFENPFPDPSKAKEVYFEEFMPVKLMPYLNHYKEEKICCTNKDIEHIEDIENLNRYNDLVLYFI